MQDFVRWRSRNNGRQKQKWTMILTTGGRAPVLLIDEVGGEVVHFDSHARDENGYSPEASSSSCAKAWRGAITEVEFHFKKWAEEINF